MEKPVPGVRHWTAFAGAIIIALGVFFLLTPFVPRLNREWRPDVLISRAARAAR